MQSVWYNLIWLCLTVMRNCWKSDNLSPSLMVVYMKKHMAIVTAKPVFIYIFIHLVVCLTTGPKRALHIVRSRASSFKWEYPLLSLRSSNSFLCLLPCLPVTSIPPCIFPSVTCSRRQFLRKMWPIQFAFRLRVSCRIFLCSFTLSNTSSFLTWSVQQFKFTKHYLLLQ